MRAFPLTAVAVVLVAISFPFDVVAHGGGLDSLGCHHNRKQGGYHCHRGSLAGRYFGSKAEALEALGTAGGTATPLQPTPPISAPAAVSGAVPYDRSLYRHWIDADGDCQDTRHEVLIAESQEAVQLDARGCRVVSGRWYDPYTGQSFTDHGRLDIDHLVPLAEAHRSGADAWDAQRRQDYANDLMEPETLIAVSASANRSKGDKDPAQWMPPNTAYHCDYIRAWVKVKVRWGLGMDGEELRAVENVRNRCGQ